MKKVGGFKGQADPPVSVQCIESSLPAPVIALAPLLFWAILGGPRVLALILKRFGDHVSVLKITNGFVCSLGQVLAEGMMERATATLMAAKIRALVVPQKTQVKEEGEYGMHTATKIKLHPQFSNWEMHLR